jgi:hypothetical protein
VVTDFQRLVEALSGGRVDYIEEVKKRRPS